MSSIFNRFVRYAFELFTLHFIGSRKLKIGKLYIFDLENIKQAHTFWFAKITKAHNGCKI